MYETVDTCDMGVHGKGCGFMEGSMQRCKYSDVGCCIHHGMPPTHSCAPRRPRGLHARQWEDPPHSPASGKKALHNHSENRCSVWLLGGIPFSSGQSGDVLRGAVAE